MIMGRNKAGGGVKTEHQGEEIWWSWGLIVLDESSKGLRQIRDRSGNGGRAEEESKGNNRQEVHIQTNLNQHLTDVKEISIERKS